MYSWQIHSELERYNYTIPSKLYKEICDSPQIQKIKYEPFSNYYEIWTQDGYYWKFCLRKGEK